MTKFLESWLRAKPTRQLRIWWRVSERRYAARAVDSDVKERDGFVAQRHAPEVGFALIALERELEYGKARG